MDHVPAEPLWLMTHTSKGFAGTYIRIENVPFCVEFRSITKQLP
jgi:hypothetical protein